MSHYTNIFLGQNANCWCLNHFKSGWTMIFHPSFQASVRTYSLPIIPWFLGEAHFAALQHWPCHAAWRSAGSCGAASCSAAWRGSSHPLPGANVRDIEPFAWPARNVKPAETGRFNQYRLIQTNYPLVILQFTAVPAARGRGVASGSPR